MKLFILGIDSLDRTLLHRLAPYLMVISRKLDR